MQDEYLARVTIAIAEDTFNSAWFGPYKTKVEAIRAVLRCYPGGDVIVMTAGEFYGNLSGKGKK